MFASFSGQYHHIGIATISIVITLVLSIFGWFVYAYFFPHTWSGQLLIKVRLNRCSMSRFGVNLFLSWVWTCQYFSTNDTSFVLLYFFVSTPRVNFINWGHFHKSFSTLIFWCEITTFWQHILINMLPIQVFLLTILVFKLPILAFLKPNLYYEIDHWKGHHFLALCCENFGIKAFMKLNIEKAIHILSFWSTNFGV